METGTLNNSSQEDPLPPLLKKHFRSTFRSKKKQTGAVQFSTLFSPNTFYAVVLV